MYMIPNLTKRSENIRYIEVPVPISSDVGGVGMIYMGIWWIFFAISLVSIILTFAVKKHNTEEKPFIGRIFVYVSAHRRLFLLLLFVVFLFSRLYYLGVIPSGLHVDELGMAYDAYSLSHYGIDRHHVSLPVYLENYGGGQSALYAYLTALLLKFVPYSPAVIRMPAVICGVFCFFAAYFLSGDLTSDMDGDKKENGWLSLMGPFFVTVTPFFMMSERWGLDCNLFLSLAAVSLCVSVRAFGKRSRGLYILAGICWGITLYTYAISYMVIPLFAILAGIYVICIYRDKTAVGSVVCFLAPIVILGIPLLIFQLVNMGIVNEFDLGFTQFRKLKYYRESEVSIRNIPKNLLYVFRSMYGTDGLTYNAFNEFGPVYSCMIPLAVFGGAAAVRDAAVSVGKRCFKPVVITTAFFLSSWAAILLVYGVGFNVVNFIFISHVIFAVYGMKIIFSHSRQAACVMVVCTGLYFLIFSEFYFRRQNEVYGMHSLFTSTKPGDMITYAENMYDPAHEKKLYICMEYDDKGGLDLYAGLYGQIPPLNWDPDRTDLGDIYLNLPDEFDPDEDAVYIIGDEWSGVISAILSEGYQDDTLFEHEHILHR